MGRWRGKASLAWATLSSLCGVASAFYVQPYIHSNSDASNLIVTVFAVFAGVVMALITVIGDPALMGVGSWRSAENNYNRIDNQLIRQAFLFFVYIFVIFLFLAAYVLKGMNGNDLAADILIWLERAYLFFATSALLMSLSLPLTMLRLQRRRLALEIEKRRHEAGIKS